MATIRDSTDGARARDTRASGPPERQPEPDERTLREERILDAAAALLVRWGYRKTTIDDVAREAGVGKGTIYLHWKDKNELFRAVVLRAQQQASAEMMERITADPEGGRFHRLWAYGMLAALSTPVMAAIMQGKTDIFQGLKGAFDPATLYQLTGDYEAYVVQLQQAGLVRADVPVPVISFLTTALKIGIINTPDLLGQEHTPPMEQLIESLSDLIRRWLEPEHMPEDTTHGKQFLTEWLEKVKNVEDHL
jgi:AcrR family transcriptional regulator